MASVLFGLLVFGFFANAHCLSCEQGYQVNDVVVNITGECGDQYGSSAVCMRMEGEALSAGAHISVVYTRCGYKSNCSISNCTLLSDYFHPANRLAVAAAMSITSCKLTCCEVDNCNQKSMDSMTTTHIATVASMTVISSVESLTETTEIGNDETTTSGFLQMLKPSAYLCLAMLFVSQTYVYSCN